MPVEANIIEPLALPRSCFTTLERLSLTLRGLTSNGKRQTAKMTSEFVFFSSHPSLRWLKTVSSTNISMGYCNTIYHLMLQSWYHNTAQLLVNTLLSFS